jgi:hypothetical protein
MLQPKAAKQDKFTIFTADSQPDACARTSSIFVQNHALTSNFDRTQANYDGGLNFAGQANDTIKTDLEFILQRLRMGHRKIFARRQLRVQPSRSM